MCNLYKPDVNVKVIINYKKITGLQTAEMGVDIFIFLQNDVIIDRDGFLTNKSLYESKKIKIIKYDTDSCLLYFTVISLFTG